MLTPCGIKNAQKYLTLSTAKRTPLLTHGPNSHDNPEILTGAPNGESRKDKLLTNQIKKITFAGLPNSTLTYALIHGGYRVKYTLS